MELLPDDVVRLHVVRAHLEADHGDVREPTALAALARTSRRFRALAAGARQRHDARIESALLAIRAMITRRDFAKLMVRHPLARMPTRRSLARATFGDDAVAIVCLMWTDHGWHGDWLTLTAVARHGAATITPAHLRNDAGVDDTIWDTIQYRTALPERVGYVQLTMNITRDDARVSHARAADAAANAFVSWCRACSYALLPVRQRLSRLGEISTHFDVGELVSLAQRLAAGRNI